MIDPAPRRPATASERWIIGILVALFTGAILVDLVMSGHLAAWSVPFMMLCWGPLLVVHEVGHAVAARAVGWHVHEITLGFGRALYRFRIGRTRVVIRRVPLEGFVVPLPTSTRWARLKHAFVYAAGPGSEALVLAAVYVATGPTLFSARPEDMWLLFLQSLALAVALGLFSNLLPHVTSDGRISDGLGILRSFFLTKDAIDNAIARPDIEDAERLFERGELAHALERLGPALADAPRNVFLQIFRARLTSALGNAEEAAAILDALESGTLSAEAGLALWLSRAEIALDSPIPVLLRDAELALDRARKLDPIDPHILATHGAILVERRRFEEAVPLLEAALAAARGTPAEARCLAYLAIASHRVGDETSAAKFLTHLRECDAAPRLLSRVSDEIGSTTRGL